MECERCSSTAEFELYERYQDRGAAVEASEWLCRECAAGVSPDAIDKAYANYTFKVEPIPEEFGMRETDLPG